MVVQGMQHHLFETFVACDSDRSVTPAMDHNHTYTTEVCGVAHLSGLSDMP